MGRLLCQSGNPRSPQDWGELGSGSGLGVRGPWNVLALPLVAGQTMHYFLCLLGRLGFGEQWKTGPKKGWRKEQKRQHWGIISPMGGRGLTPTWVFKQVDQVSFFKN